ncbi:MAG TPA: transglycosylase SLT domain-containing protein [Steroidobacteraceae bacterium]
MRGLRFRPVAFTVLVLLGWRTLPAAPPPDLTGARQQFLQAMAQVQRPANEPAAAPTPAAMDDAALRSYPLYPYLQAERIRQAFNDATQVAAADRRAAGFLATYGLLPVGIQLRRSWLESLAQRSQWDAFLTIYREAAATEALRCQAFTAKIATGQTAQLGPSLVRQWLTTREVPECDGPYAWGIDHGIISADLIERRARLALQAGNTSIAKPLIARLPATQALPLQQWVALLDTPLRTVDTLLHEPTTTVLPEALLAGWMRLARQDPDAAVDRYAQLVRTRNLTSQSAGAFALAVALPLAWRRDARAEEYFARVSTRELDDTVLEWRARAAMWAGNWSLVTQTIAAMSEANRQSARWRYWSARALELTGDSAQAHRLFATLAPDDNYYSGLAAARLGINVTPHPQPLDRDEAVRARLAQTPALVRARELLLCELRNEAMTEWQFAFDELSASERLQAIGLAADWGWYDLAVTAASSLHIYYDYELLYPQPYESSVTAAAHASRLPISLIYGVIRQESLYRSDVVSSAGARGLMQLELATARPTARALKLPTPHMADLFDPQINSTLGAEHLHLLLDKVDGQLPLALAAYNAGIAAASRWLPAVSIAPDVWVENIPYNETRTYVQRILWHTVVYGWLRSDGQPQDTASWLTPIRATGPAEARIDRH